MNASLNELLKQRIKENYKEKETNEVNQQELNKYATEKKTVVVIGTRSK